MSPADVVKFKRVDGKMSEAEHQHVLIQAFAREGLQLDFCADGLLVLDELTFATRTEAWTWLFKWSQSQAIEAKWRAARGEWGSR